jgi:hypothetical protein
MESKEKRIDHLKNIDTEMPEGRLLTAALGKLVRFMPGKTYEDILLKLNEISDKIFYNGNFTANDNRQRSPRPFLEATNGGTDETRKDGNPDVGDTVPRPSSNLQ